MKISSLKHLCFLLKCKATTNELLSICAQLNDPSHGLDSDHYREKKEVRELPNGKFKTRILHPSLNRLKLIQGRLKKNVFDLIEFPPCVIGGVKGSSNITNASMHLGNKFKFTTDIKNFFPSIKPKQIYNCLLKLGFTPIVAKTVTTLTTYKGRLPQGTPTSTHLANLVMMPVDLELNAFCKSERIVYTRYVDDITLSSSVDFQKIIPHVTEIVRLAGFQISARKTGYKHLIDITGISTGNNSLRPNEKFFKRLEETQTDNAYQARMHYLTRVKSAKKP